MNTVKLIDMHNVTDSLGKKIDKRIKYAVQVFNTLNFKTTASCQGHIKHGLPFPWIEFNLPQTYAKINYLQQDIIKNLLIEYSKVKNNDLFVQNMGQYGGFRLITSNLKINDSFFKKNEIKLKNHRQQINDFCNWLLKNETAIH